MAKKPPKALPPVPDSPPPDDEPDEEDDAISEKQRRHILVGFRRTKKVAEERVTHLSHELDDGKLDSQEWAREFRKLLADAHSHANGVGRNLAGDLGPFGADDVAAGQAAWDAQEKYFTKFLADLEAGRYTKDDALNLKAFDARARSYVQATRGTAHESFRIALGDEPTDWNLSAAEHCKPSPDFPYDCPSLADESPKPASQWQTAPARGDCPCRSNCLCFLSTSSGEYSSEGI